MIDKFNRISLGHLPTPIEKLNKLSEHLKGPEIYIKRDDCTGLASGGNKTRKLEFLMPDAIDNQADLVVTVGAVQSNHTRQTAAACAKLGLKCLIVLEQRLADAPDAYMTSGNVFLDKIFGAEVIICPKGKDVKEHAEEIMSERKNNGANPYYIPVGGSNRIGQLGYIECLREIIEYDKDNLFTHIVLASGSGGTHSGIVTGKAYYKSNINIIGISVKDNKYNQEEKIYKMAQDGCKYIQCDEPKRDYVEVFDGYVGEGYGVPTKGMIDAVKLLATKEAILLDPVYSGKGFAGLIDLIQKKHFKDSDKVLFIHTGGAVALHGYEWAF
ncbi:MAG TPA: D-cysteine desulfhydrase [Gammaproteobacteria bacterium]|jgi:L-cysteate sulfo-lyase|nr:D-cysteine desulfhydrase [Gammaproteobacteria bacterium]|tara:strand:+ start:2598 stop:3578 length:981 start_codon:yes stop_codon:yes gene_type:complete